MMRFDGKSVIVTGAASGIGRATALAFAAEGGRVVVADRSEVVRDTAATIAAQGGAAEAMILDVGLEADVEHLIAFACDRYGGIDILHANAGISGGIAGLFEGSADSWAELLRINLIGPFLTIKYAAPKMVERGGGAIICTASVAGLRSGAGGPAYSASKAGVINLVQTSAQQLSGTGVRVNAVCPGLVETAMTARAFDYAREHGKLDQVGKLNPLRRGAQPEEIANAVLFLASADASYVNGQALVVDGGLSASHPFTRQEYGRTAA